MRAYMWSRASLVLFAMLMPLHLPFYVAPPVDSERVIGLWASPRRESGALEHVVTRIMWPASGSGLVPGDVILSVNGQPTAGAQLGRLPSIAHSGEPVRIQFRRNGRERTAVVPISDNTVSYVVYRWYRVALALFAWLIGTGIVAVRGGSVDALLLGGVLLLLGPVTLPVAIPDRGGLITLANHVWQLAGAGYRFLLPMLSFLFLLRHSSRRQLVESRAVRVTLVAMAVITLSLITGGLRSPLDWAVPGFRQTARTVAGLGAEVIALAGLLWIRKDFRGRSGPLAWLSFALTLVLVSGGLLSLAMLIPLSGRVSDALRQVKALTLAPLPVTVVLYFLLGHGRDASDSWQLRRHAAAFVYALLLGLYGFAVAGAAAIALSTTGRSLGGAEATLFAAIFFGAIVFSPVLQWAREAIDRRVFAHWVAMEQRAHALVDELNGDLDVQSVAARLGQALPAILDLHSARLILTSELADKWGLQPADAPGREPQSRLEYRVAAGPVDAERLEPVRRPTGELIGAIEYRLAGHRRLTPPERTALHAVAQGATVALRNAEAHFELQRANRELAESEKISVVGSMACGLAHEIKNPLASLKLALHLLAKESVDPDRLRRIERDVRRIDDLVSSLFRFVRNSDREPRTPIDMRAAVGSAVEDLASLARDRHVRITHSYPDDSIMILGGQSEVRVLVSNLLRNSVDASTGGGRVNVAVASTPDEALIEISDSGPGIPRERQTQVFEMNYSTKPDGSGLGLALARREAEWLGGRIELESRPRHGTLFRVRLPKMKVLAQRGPA